MKRSFLFFAVLVTVCAAVSAQIDLSGQASCALNVFPSLPYTSERFESPVNPGNITGIQDVALNTDVIFRLDAQQEAGRMAGGLTLWLSLNPYQMSRLLLGAASGEPVQEQEVGAGLLSSDPAAVSVLRADIAWYIGRSFVLRLGRQNLLTGYGYGWNPMDFANTVKDPFDPEAELRGVDALSLQFHLGNLFALKLSGIIRFDDFAAAKDFEDLQAGAELTASFPLLELKFSGYYDYDDAAGEDAYVPALGAGFMLDLAGVGLYGEGALLWGGRTPVPLAVPLAPPERKEDLLVSGLLGVEYIFTSELRLIAEYYYNGEGYSGRERELFNDRLADNPDNYAAHVASYRPGYFAKHYLLLNLGYPIYARKTDLELSAYYSPDSGALGIMPSVELEVSGSLSARAGYTGMFSCLDDRYDEAWFSPVNHVVELRLTYYF